jgi:aryl-alcohol dehydrogenase-like predicted oxidoreductase
MEEWSGEMEKRRLGRSELFVSRLGLGCMSLGTDEKVAREIIEAGLSEGINYFDTADLYDFGTNERIVGQALKPVREQVIIASKVGNRWNANKDSWSWDPSKAYIKEQVKQSIKRLGTDYIDLYQLHGGTTDDPIQETIDAFEELKSEGFIKYYGISSIRPNVIREYVEKSNIVSVMMQYSILDRRPEEEALPLLYENGIGVVTRGSLAKGLLSKQLLEKASNNIRLNGYLDYSFAELSELLPLLTEKLASSGRPFTEIAFQYCLANPAITSIVAGASSAAQLRENCAAVLSSPLTDEEVQLIKQLTKENRYEQHR